MNKKTYSIIGVVVLLFIAGAVVVITQHKQSVATSKVASCTTKDNRRNLTLSANDDQYIENAAIGQIVNVPAGTQVDVNLKSYDGSVVAGSTIYAGNYGSYNFTLRKDINASSGNRINWTTTSFAPCKR